VGLTFTVYALNSAGVALAHIISETPIERVPQRLGCSVFFTRMNIPWFLSNNSASNGADRVFWKARGNFCSLARSKAGLVTVEWWYNTFCRHCCTGLALSYTVDSSESEHPPDPGKPITLGFRVLDQGRSLVV
jgi:hypothetical protein